MEVIEARLNSVELFLKDRLLRVDIRAHLKRLSDSERVLQRLKTKPPLFRLVCG